jgi:purine-nucleoside phosphorylase
MTTAPAPPLHHPDLDRMLAALRRRVAEPVEVGVLLGSGLSAVVERTEVELDIAYAEIDGYPTTRIPGHPGRLAIGRLGDKRCAIFVGRFHYYEGATAAVVTLPVQVAAGLGARTMVLTNSASGLNPAFQSGDIVFIHDHLNLMGCNPLVEMTRDYAGNAFAAGQPTPFVTLVRAYRADLYARLRRRLAQEDLALRQGVLAALLGPNYESPAEVRMLRTLGADVVCMSTVPEVIYARYAGLDVLALSFVSNLCHDGGAGEEPCHERVLKSATEGARKFSLAVEEAIRLL